MNKVVVTGLGVLSPFGLGVEHSWQQLLEGQSGAGPITYFDPSKFACHIACEVPRTGEGAFYLDDFFDKKDQRRLDLFAMYGIVVAKLAFDDAGWRPSSDEERNRTGVVMASGIGGIRSLEEGARDLIKKGKVSPFLVPSLLINMASGQISIRENLRGPSIMPVSACATGTNAIGEAMCLITRGVADVIIAGGTEASVCPLGIAGFAACRALSTSFNDEPTKASRPYDKDRDGFVLGEGAAALILESEAHAKARGARIYAEIIGYGMSSDAYHVTSPSPDGDGAKRSMEAAIKDADISPSDIGYINAHGTSTQLGDAMEIEAIERVFGNQIEGVSVSSTKSATGHLLGAAGALEAVFSILALRDQKIPPTLNLDHCDIDTELDLVPHQYRKKNINIVMSNSFGFGGTNASLIFRAV